MEQDGSHHERERESIEQYCSSPYYPHLLLGGHHQCYEQSQLSLFIRVYIKINHYMGVETRFTGSSSHSGYPLITLETMRSAG